MHRVVQLRYILRHKKRRYNILRKAFQKLEERSRIRQTVALTWLQASRVSHQVTLHVILAYVIPAMNQGEANALDALTSFMKSIKSSLLSKYITESQNKTFTTKKNFKMPLVVPGINSGGDASKTEEWQNKLVGKKIGEGASDATVYLLIHCRFHS